jgi:phenylpropionate dioxygenase-like ring-hydroxylating dioxygenase large terminal subunit
MTMSETRPRYQLPPEAYYDPAWYAREQQLLFGRNYNLVAYEVDIPEAGDYLVTMVGVEPIVVVRGRDSVVRGYINMCRHRGIVLASENGHTDGNFRCPYHGWEYGLDGKLDRVPQRQSQFPDLDIDALGLIPVSVGTWAGMIFVHLDPAAEPLESWLDEFVRADRAGPYPWEQLVHVKRFNIPLACNWKLYIENHIDIYHLWYLHETSLSMYDHHALTHWQAGAHWGCVEPLRGDRERTRLGMVPISGVPESEHDLLRANLIFPNVPHTTSETNVMTYQVVPTGPETCYLDIRVLGEPGSELSSDNDVLLVLRDEDGFACEQMQIAMKSRNFAVGPLAAEHELPIHQFHTQLREFLE